MHTSAVTVRLPRLPRWCTPPSVCFIFCRTEKLTDAIVIARVHVMPSSELYKPVCMNRIVLQSCLGCSPLIWVAFRFSAPSEFLWNYCAVSFTLSRMRFRPLTVSQPIRLMICTSHSRWVHSVILCSFCDYEKFLGQIFYCIIYKTIQQSGRLFEIFYRDILQRQTRFAAVQQYLVLSKLDSLL